MTIKTLLVANRGEIARRIFRTAKSMGITCVAVYTNTDSNEPFVKEADKAIRLSTSYLDEAEIINAAKKTESDAIHPGYGFLSENASFAKAVIGNFKLGDKTPKTCKNLYKHLVEKGYYESINNKRNREEDR